MRKKLHMVAHLRAGYTILELAIVITIVALIITMTITVGIARIEMQRANTTDTRMTYLIKALKAYVDVYGHLPCPADGALATTDTNYGWGAGTGTGTCSASNLQDSGTVVAGAIPVINLGIDPLVSVDGWGNKITYVVTEALTNPKTFSGNGAITILNGYSGGGPVTY
ncbi:MAG: hypothetical protein KDD76_06910, partial [Rickettsiales bacterium]|nr:hypothetical protein [Rickettsiales bacterium]